MKRTIHLLKKTVLLLALIICYLITGCGITTSGLHQHAGYANIESPYWWKEESKVNLSLGPLTIGTARWVIDTGEDPAIDALLDDVDGVRISIYKIKENSEEFKENIVEAQANLHDDGWQRVVRVNDESSADYSLMYIKSNGDIIDGLVVLSLSDDEAVFVNIIGNIHPDSFDPIMEKVNTKYKSEKHSAE